MEYIAFLQDVHLHNRTISGDKAFNLGELLRACLPIPSGFVVSTAAYERFLQANGLQAEIEPNCVLKDKSGSEMPKLLQAVLFLLDEVDNKLFYALPKMKAAAKTSAPLPTTWTKEIHQLVLK